MRDVVGLQIATTAADIENTVPLLRAGDPFRRIRQQHAPLRIPLT